ncbi:MAG TPA: M14 family metallopeptidase [Cyclobacteriaceae bacterium]|nr:M14 family metallopeptidase [Cyclobacteriaceae bacterium]
MKKLIVYLIIVTLHFSAKAQVDLNYYLPAGVNFNPSIPTPASVIGHEVGEWHISHDRLVNYMMALDKASDRISLEVTGYTYEGRPLLLLTVTAPKNHSNIENIRQQHLTLTDPSRSTPVDVKNMPVIFYLGCSIHGNEPSGANAGLIMAYYLAAAQGPEIEKYLDNTVLLFDPSFNPDGLNRFSTWANSRKSKLISPDPNDMEHNESWPGGRFNHYWFDLNRDWMVAQHPESQARIKKFQQWKPNVLTDHHEQGTNATFFFMPGEPTRVHPLTPDKNQELTRKMGEYHAKALDQIGSLYFTQEGYDDFYYGKGSTYPDAQGAIGILFEQASSRGHAQESINGILTFPFTIRNHFVTMLSSLKAVNDLREELLNYQRDFYKSSLTEAAKDPVKAYLFGSKDKVKVFQMAEVLSRQQIEFYKPASSTVVNGKNFDVESSYILPLNQAQYRLAKGMFGKMTQFKDSIFYDISSWTPPLAFGLDFEELKTMPALGEKAVQPTMPVGKVIGEKSKYAYVFETYGFYSPRAIYRLVSHGIRAKVSTTAFYHSSGKKFEHGTVMIPLENQDKNPDQIEVYVREIAERDGIDVYGFNTGLDYRGVSLGSSSFQPLNKPVIAMLVEGGVEPTSAGEMWHLFDQRFNIPITCMPLTTFNTANLNRYTTIIFPAGSYASVSENAKEKLKTWIQGGGVVIGFENALNWFQSAGMGKFEMKKDEEKKEPAKSKVYGDLEDATRAQQTSGAIFEADIDITNPLFYGYYTGKLPMFKDNNLFMERAKGVYANPLTYGSAPLLSGYISKLNYPKMKNTSGIGISAVGRGRVIGFTEDLAFRAFWFGTNKVLLNAVYYGGWLSNETSR